MNIEELELSLRTEFEGQIRNVLAGIKQDVTDFHSKFQSELDDHRSRLDQAIADLSTRLPESTTFDAAFNESVNEHLRLARDDGAQVAATAFGEAEKLRVDVAPAVQAGGFDMLRDAIAEISSKNSQATILQSLVAHASRFAARGAFFIVKNDQFVGWKVFGSEARDEAVRDILFSCSADTLLAASTKAMAKVSATEAYSHDSVFLEPLQFGSPAEMYAFPLVARGRGVAVLYADGGHEGKINADAIETLVRVAAITVELLAASNAAPAAVQAPISTDTASFTYVAPAVEESASYEAPQVEESVAPAEEEVEAETTPAYDPYQPAAVEYSYEASEEVAEPVAEYAGEVTYEVESHQPEAVEVPVVEAPAVERFEAVAEVEVESAPEPEPVSDFAFSSNGSYDASETEVSYDVPVVEAPVAASLNGHAEVATVAEPVVETVVEPVVEVASAEPKKSRFSDRNVDLPIEVADEERKLHNDARRFARLLVSEIKLYNEQKVNEGRESGDLYTHLKEAIDRSREMYDKRVQPAVASKFDYFHYEVVNSLAEGQDAKLGAGYPGATV